MFDRLCNKMMMMMMMMMMICLRDFKTAWWISAFQ